MSSPFGDSYSAVQSAADAQQQERDRRSAEAQQAFLQGQQLALARQNQTHQFLLQNRQLDLQQRAQDYDHQYRMGLVDWRNNQLQAQKDAATTQAHVAAQQTASGQMARENIAQTIADNLAQAAAAKNKAQSDFDAIDQQRSTIMTAAQRDQAQGKIAVGQNGVVSAVPGKTDAETQQNQALALSYNATLGRLQPQWQKANAVLQQEGGDFNNVTSAASANKFVINHATGELSDLLSGKKYTPSTPDNSAPAYQPANTTAPAQTTATYQPANTGAASAPSAQPAQPSPSGDSNSISGWSPALPGSNGFPTVQFGSQAHQQLSPGSTYLDPSDGQLHIKAPPQQSAPATVAGTNSVPAAPTPASAQAAGAWQPAMAGYADDE